MSYLEKLLIERGLDTKWVKGDMGEDILVCRNPSAQTLHGRTEWHYFTEEMYDFMFTYGVVEGFNRCSLMPHIFYSKF